MIFSHRQYPETMYDQDCSTGSGDTSTLIGRLVDAGVPRDQLRLCVDNHVHDDDDDDNVAITKEVDTESIFDDEEKKQIPIDGTDAVEIKTLIWEVSYYPEGEDIDHRQTSYLTTASKLADKINVSALRRLVELQQGCGSSSSCRLSLAPRQIAESLSGFRSGCIPPIGHTTQTPLFVDASILTKGDMFEDIRILTASIGSGTHGKSLLLPMTEFMKVARGSDTGVVVDSFVQQSALSDTEESRQKRHPDLTPTDIRQQRKIERMSNWPGPKDRLHEFRTFSDIVDKSKLFRSTARKQGRTEEMKALVDEAVTTGIFPDLFEISVENGIAKNALHICAWRGDFETVRLIVETAEDLYPTLDLVNVISEGQANYGKTPIFFALTQCRENVVRYLVSRGANLLIVDNKGQTPCSIAVSHLSESACGFLFQAEAEQLKEGGTFRNYRMSHSDGKLYGDLDPRFPIDDVNLGLGDMAFAMSDYEGSVREAPIGTIFHGVPTQFQPRSLRPTVRWWIREARSLAEANEAGYGEDACEITFTQPRFASPPRLREEKGRRSLSPRRIQGQPDAITIDGLPRLTVKDIFDESTSGGISNALCVVEDMESLRVLEQEIDESLIHYLDYNQNLSMTHDDILVASTWALDCEWRPGNGFGVENPVATLQLSTRRRAFLVDLQSICQDFRSRPQTATDLEGELDRILSRLFHNSGLPLLGYGIVQDLDKLAGSFPHLKCFAGYGRVIDLQTVATAIYPKGERQSLSSLQKLGAVLLQKRLDKTEQCSDWTMRPLSPSQLDYAMLDAAILPRLLKTLIQESSMTAGYNGQFFIIHSRLQSNIRYRKVEPAQEDERYEVPRGTVKRILGQQHFVRQCWPLCEDEPAPPRLIPISVIPEDRRKVVVHKMEQTPSQKEQPENVSEKAVKRVKALPLKTLVGNLDNLPSPGVTLGYTKDSCVHRVIGHRFLNTLPDGTRIGFNRKAGVVETNNAWILFCNFESKSEVGKTYSQFFKDGRHLSFRLNPNAQAGKSSESSLYKHLMASTDSDTRRQNDKRILLFVREGTRSKYLYCGYCNSLGTTKYAAQDGGATGVLFELLDFDELTGDHRITSDFVDLIANLQMRYKSWMEPEVSTIRLVG